MTDPMAPLRAWLTDWHTAVRNRDFDAGKTLCAPDLVAFGTVAPFVMGIENVMKAQWEHVWPYIKGFTIDAAGAHGGIEGDHGWVAATWESRGLRPDGTDFHRPGRCTIIFARRHGRWLATHTHFSLSPNR